MRLTHDFSDQFRLPTWFQASENGDLHNFENRKFSIEKGSVANMTVKKLID
jgi:hypothetical protein